MIYGKLYTVFADAKQYFLNSLTAAGTDRRVLPRCLYNEKIQSFGRSTRVPTDLKSTINLPKTGFPMKAGLPQNEPKMLARWEEQRIYDRIREVRKGAPTYVL